MVSRYVPNMGPAPGQHPLMGVPHVGIVPHTHAAAAAAAAAHAMALGKPPPQMQSAQSQQQQQSNQQQQQPDGSGYVQQQQQTQQQQQQACLLQQPTHHHYRLVQRSEFHVTTPPGGGYVQTQSGPTQAVPPSQQQQQQQQVQQQTHRGMAPTAPPTPPQQQQPQQQPQQQDMSKMQQQQPPMPIQNFVPNATSVRGAAPNTYPTFRPQGQLQQPRLAHHRSYLPHAMYQQPMMFGTPMMPQGQFQLRQSTPTQYFSNFNPATIINTQHQMQTYAAFNQPSPSQQYYFSSVPQMGIPPRNVQGTNVPTVVPVPQQQQMPMQGSVMTQHQHQSNQINKAPKNQRRKHAIKIVNPDSGKDVLEEVLDEKSTDESEDSSERQTPQPVVTNPEVAAEFAARVALMIEKDESNIRSTNDETHLINVHSGGDTMDGSVQTCSPDMTMLNQHNHSDPKLISNAKAVSGEVQVLTQGVSKLGFIEHGLTEDDLANETKVLKDIKSEISVSESKLQANTREFIPENQQGQRISVVSFGNSSNNTTPVVSAMSDGPSVEIVPKHSSKSVKNIALTQGSDSKVQNRKQNKNTEQTQNAEIKTETAKPPTGKESQSKSKRNSESEVKLRLENSAVKKEIPNTKGSDKPNGQELTSAPEANSNLSKSSRKENQPGKQAASAINQQQQNSKDAPQSARPLYQQKQQSAPNTIPNATISVPMPQPPKPNNKTQRNKEINRKGAEKQANASDMDAFNSPSTPPAVPANIAPVCEPAPLPQQTANAFTSSANVAATLNNNETNVIASIDDTDVNSVMSATCDATKLTPDNKDVSLTSMSNNTNKPVPLASKNVLPKTLEGSKKVDVTSIVKGSDVMPKFIKKELPKESLDPLNLTEEEKLVRAKNEENKAKMEEAQSESIGDGKVGLKYIYQEDQWSPTNQGGKKVYGRDFLVALQSDPKSKVKPNLPDMDVVLKEGANRQLSRDPPRNFPSLNRQHDNLFPGFAKSQSQRVGKSSGSKGGSASSKPGIIHVSLSLRDEVKLHETENAWKPSHLKSVNLNDEQKQTEELYKKVRGVLNKLTPQKFETLVRQVRDLDINTTERLKGVMDLVFEKAVDEPSFSVAYAYMCKELALIQVPAEQQNGQSTKVDYVNFRKLLISRCQNEFEKNTVDETAREVKLKEIEECTDPEKKKELQFTLDEEERRMRVKSVGNVRFIGELFKQGMLTTNIMMQCLKMLLQTIDEESLECLCKLLTTIGRDLETNKQQNLNATFIKMQEIVDRKHGKISSRVRFMLQDVIELRMNKWKPRHNDTNPKTMDQIQKDAEIEQMQIQMLNSTPTPRKDNDRRGGGMGGSMGSGNDRKRNQTSEDGWSTAGGRGSRSHNFLDMSKLRQSLMPAIQATEDISLGKPQYGNWGHGSNMKSTPTQINYYSALENVEDERRGSRNKNDPGYHSKGPSMERYKKYDENRSSRSGSQHRSRDNSSSRAHSSLHTGGVRSQQLPGPMSSMPPMTRQGSMPPPVVPPTNQLPPSQPQAQIDNSIKKDDIPEKLLNKIKVRIVDIIEDYANSSFKLDAAGQEIKSLCTVNQLYGCVRELYTACLEKNQFLREKAAQIIIYMIKNKLLPVKSYLDGIEEVLEYADDLRVDIPKMWEYLADLTAPVLAADCIGLKEIHKVSPILISQDLAGEFIAAIFKALSKEKGPGFVKELWAKSGLSWKSFMDEKKIEDFVKSKELDYVTGGAIHATNSSSNNLSMKQIQDKLLRFMTENDTDANIEQWITMNVGDMSNGPTFARALMTAVCEHSVTKQARAWVLRENAFKKHYDLLTTYVSNKPDNELQALYAIQCYMHKLEYPQGVLVQLFNMLWDSGIITADSFLQWKNSNDPAEIEGKGVAEKCLVSFFTVLQEQDDESSTEE